MVTLFGRRRPPGAVAVADRPEAAAVPVAVAAPALRWADSDGAALARLSARLVAAMAAVDGRQVTLADLERADALARLLLQPPPAGQRQEVG